MGLCHDGGAWYRGSEDGLQSKYLAIQGLQFSSVVDVQFSNVFFHEDTLKYRKKKILSVKIMT